VWEPTCWRAVAAVRALGHGLYVPPGLASIRAWVVGTVACMVPAMLLFSMSVPPVMVSGSQDVVISAGVVVAPGASLRDLMTRMGHDNPRAAMNYQHATTIEDRLSGLIDAHRGGLRTLIGRMIPARMTTAQRMFRFGQLMERMWHARPDAVHNKSPGHKELLVTWAFVMERVTGIEPASRAWELHGMHRTGPVSSGFG
jgi:hypothetical protein